MHDREPVVIVLDEHECVLAAPAKKKRGMHIPRWPTRLIGIGLTGLVHLLIATPFVLGAAAQKQRTSPDGIGTTAWTSQGEQFESMTLIDLSALESSSQLDVAMQAPTESQITADVPLILVGYEPSPPPELKFEDAEISNEANPATGDPAANAALLGRYMGHVMARIDRVWQRPRFAVAFGHFDCRARITQDRDGNVLDIGLAPCDPDLRWRNSLVAAIRRSAPISSPPEPWLFTSTITLQFTADQYSAGVTPEYLYEPADRRLAMTTESRDPIALGPEPGDYVLTNSGSQLVLKKRASAAKRQ